MIKIPAKALLTALQAVSGVVEKRHTLPIFSHVLLQNKQGHLTFTATDLEIEIFYHLFLEENVEEIITTLPCRKLIEICRVLPEDTLIHLYIEKNWRLKIETKQGQFIFNTYNPEEFPKFPEREHLYTFTLASQIFSDLLEKTYFAIASEDVRLYLTGLLLELDSQELKAVSTDGHRLALARHPMEGLTSEKIQVIIPRKAIGEMAKNLNTPSLEVQLSFDKQRFWLKTPQWELATKLIDSKFPPYGLVIPKNIIMTAIINRDELKQVLQRVSILSGEGRRGVEFLFKAGQLKLFANNTDQEQGEEIISIDYEGQELLIVLNSQYILDVLNALPEGKIIFSIQDVRSGILIQSPLLQNLLYVVMPMQS